MPVDPHESAAPQPGAGSPARPPRRRDLRRAAREAREAAERSQTGAAVGPVADPVVPETPEHPAPVEHAEDRTPVYGLDLAGESAPVTAPAPAASPAFAEEPDDAKERVPVRTEAAAAPGSGSPPSGAPPSGSPRSGSPRRPHPYRTSVIGVALAVVIVLGLGVLILSAVRPRLPEGGASPSSPVSEAAALDYPGPGTGEVVVEIPAEASSAEMGQVLVDSGVVLTVAGFEAAYGANADAGQIQPGTYRLLGEMASKDAVTALLDPARRQDLQLTIPTGYRTDQIYTRISDVLGVPLEEVHAASRDYPGMGLEGPPNATEGVIDPLEGWLLAGTYTVGRSSTPAEVLRQMYDATIAQLDALGVAPEDRQRVLTIASIAKLEAYSDADAPRVARVIVNRLADDSPTDGRLQMDSALTYAWTMTHPAGEDMDPALHDTDPSPYNTRLIAGLPPSPIATVDAALLQAAVSPEEGPWIYFVTTDLCSGETFFTDSRDELMAKQRETREWLDRYQANGSVCPVPEG